MKLLPSTEIKRVIKAAKDAGIAIGSVDIRADGIAIYPPTESAVGNAYDAWKKKQGNDGPSPR